jgi:hypothetical protein
MQCLGGPLKKGLQIFSVDMVGNVMSQLRFIVARMKSGITMNVSSALVRTDRILCGAHSIIFGIPLVEGEGKVEGSFVKSTTAISMSLRLSATDW